MAKVLIVDDVKDVRDLLTQIVQLGGHATITAPCGREALARIKDEQPDAVLLDLSMPGMSGMEVLEALKSVTADRPPVFVMTALADEYTRDRALSLGANGFFVKGDFEIDDLLHALEDALPA